MLAKPTPVGDSTAFHTHARRQAADWELMDTIAALARSPPEATDGVRAQGRPGPAGTALHTILQVPLQGAGRRTGESGAGKSA